ncbi:Uncharacterised protein [uncultured archaeon]|nr:Uncharacterised protein [uncultured archaeon]
MTAIHLDPWTDVIGLLHDLQDHDDHFLANIGPLVVALPHELEEKLKGHVGQRVSVLRAEGSDFRFKFFDGKAL